MARTYTGDIATLKELLANMTHDELLCYVDRSHPEVAELAKRFAEYRTHIRTWAGHSRDAAKVLTEEKDK